jgi:flagellar hook-associated protein 1 FlgK
MVTLFGIFDTGARALFASQVGLNTTGHNIANANTEGFSRQRVTFTTTDPLILPIGALSTGVQVQSIARLRDEFLDFQIRAQSSNSGYLDENEDIFGQLQVILQDPLNPIAELLEESPTEAGINALFKRFFSAFQELASNPESVGVRAAVRETAITLARGLNVIDSSLEDFVDGLDLQIEVVVEQVNSILSRIAQLNEEIVRIEVGEKRIANDARDARDKLLTELAELVPVSTSEQPNGSIDVRVLSSTVVTGNRVAPFEAVLDPFNPDARFQIINSIERSRVLTADFTTGKLGALLQARDTLVPDLISKIDGLAETLIREVNNVHSESIGLVTFTDLIGTTQVSDPLAALETQNLDFPPQSGEFVLRVTDADGVVQNLFTVTFDPSVDTLTDLAARIDAIDGLAGPGAGSISAEVTLDGELRITSNGGFEFTFQGDTSNILAALGMNNFFSGNDAGSIRVSDFILEPDIGLLRIAASATGAEGDNGGALAIASLESDLIADGNSATLGDAYRRIIAELGVQAQRNATLAGNSQAILDDLKNRQEAVAGVSLDEESVNLIRFQQAFNSAARFITTLDSLIDRVVNGMGVTR